MTPTNPADEVTKRSWAQHQGRWIPNPTHVNTTPGMNLFFQSLEKFDDGWEFTGVDTIRQLYYLVDQLKYGGGAPFQVLEGAFNVPGQDCAKAVVTFQHFGLDERSKYLPKDFYIINRMLLPHYTVNKLTVTRKHKRSKRQPSDLLFRRNFALPRYLKNPDSTFPSKQTYFSTNEMRERLCYLAIKYFQHSSDTIQGATGLDYVSHLPQPVISRLAPELQLVVLEKLSLAEIDRCMRSSFQNLTHLYLRTVQLRSKQFLTSLCSRENFAYAGTWYHSGKRQINTIHRLRNLNLHPELQARPYNAKDTNLNQYYDTRTQPSALHTLSLAPLLLLSTLEKISWQRCQTGIMWNNDQIWRTKTLPRALAIPIYPHNWDPSQTPHPSQPIEEIQTLLLYQDELNFILDEILPYFRPAFLKHRVVGLGDEDVQDIEDKFLPTVLPPQVSRDLLGTFTSGFTLLKDGGEMCRGLWEKESAEGVQQAPISEVRFTDWWEIDREREEMEKAKADEVEVVVPIGIRAHWRGLSFFFSALLPSWIWKMWWWK